MLAPREITRIRERLKLTQAQLGQLLGVHPLTVSKWERGTLVPNPHQAAFLQLFDRGVEHKPDVGEEAARLLVAAGVGLAIYTLLRAVFGEE